MTKNNKQKLSNKKYKGRKPKGCLRYKEGEEIEIPDSLIDQDFVDDLNYFIDLLNDRKLPMKAPGLIFLL